MSGVEWTSTLTTTPNFQNGIQIGGQLAFGAYNPVVISKDGNFTTCSISPSSITYLVSGGTLISIGFLLTIKSDSVSASGTFAPIEISVPSNCATTGPLPSIFSALSTTGDVSYCNIESATTTINEGYIKIYVNIYINSGNASINLQTISINFAYPSVGF